MSVASAYDESLNISRRYSFPFAQPISDTFRAAQTKTSA